MGRPAAKQGDKIVGTDTHIIMVPSPGGPVPTPTPLPFNGTLVGNLSSNVMIEGKPAATADSTAINQPPHIPAGGTFQKPPSNQGKILLGSTGVFINGKPAARQGDQALTCNDPTDMPTGTVMAVGRVFIGDTGTGAPRPPGQPSEQPKLLKAKIGQPGSIASAKWEKNKVRIGDEVKLTVQSKDFEDGTPVMFLVWERKGSQDTLLAQMNGEIKANKAEAKWKHSLRDSEEKLEKEVKEEEPPEYYFAVEVEGEEKGSGPLKFTYPIDIYLEDKDGNPLDDVKYVVTLSDGTKKRGKFKGGHAKIEGAPYGKFDLEVEGYELAEDEST